MRAESRILYERKVSTMDWVRARLDRVLGGH